VQKQFLARESEQESGWHWTFQASFQAVPFRFLAAQDRTSNRSISSFFSSFGATSAGRGPGKKAALLSRYHKTWNRLFQGVFSHAFSRTLPAFLDL
jgi:hypothetical protein